MSSCARFFPLSFVMCMCWIGGISYVVTWMITIIGFTLSIPDSVMGLTFLAVGTRFHFYTAVPLVYAFS